MFEAGTRVVGYTYNDHGDWVCIEGVVVSRTNDPEEMIQDYIIRRGDGTIIYCDEQEVYRS